MCKWLVLTILVAGVGGALAEDGWFYDTSGRTVVSPVSKNEACLDEESAFDSHVWTARASDSAPTDVFDSIWYSWRPSLGINLFSSEKLGLILLFR